jgi:hypothetical protein
LPVGTVIYTAVTASNAFGESEVSNIEILEIK